MRRVLFAILSILAFAPVWGSDLELRVFSDGPRLRRDEPWPEKSAVFDSAKNEIHLCGARNEVLGFQIFLKSKAAVVAGVNIHGDALTGDASAKPVIEAKNLEFFRAWYTRVETPSETGGHVHGRGVGEYADPLVPLSAPKFGAPFDLQSQTEILFGDLYIPKGTPAGTYRGSITLTSPAGTLEKLSLVLTVWNFTLPEETHFKSTMYYEVEFLRWGFRNPSADDVLKIEEDLFRLAHRHRINTPSDCGMRGTEEDWETWAKRYGKYFDGSAFTESPGKGTPLYAWRVTYNPSEDEAALRKKMKTTADWFAKKGWLDSIIFGGPDEPKPSQYPALKKSGMLVREATGGRIKFFLPGCNPDPIFQDYIDIWDGCWTQKDLPALAERRKAGQRIWYACSFGAPSNPCIDDLPYGTRSWPWVGWKYDFEGFEMWHAVYWADKFNLPSAERQDLDSHPEKYLNVWKNPATLTFDEGRKRGGKRWKEDILQNGSTSIFYPGYDIGLPRQCIASLKAKDYRRGAQDFEYLWLLDKAGERKQIEAVLAKICVTDSAVTLDDSVWESVRQDLGKKLDAIGEKK